MSHKSVQDQFIEMIEREYPNLHKYAASNEISNHTRKPYYISYVVCKTKFSEHWDSDKVYNSNRKKYRDYIKRLSDYVKENDNYITFMEL